MSSVTLDLPPEVHTNCPRQYIEYLKDRDISIRDVAKPAVGIVVALVDELFTWNTANWELRLPISRVSGARVAPGTFGDFNFICFVLAFGPDGGGVALVTGARETEAWFQAAAQKLSCLIPGGVLWEFP